MDYKHEFIANFVSTADEMAQLCCNEWVSTSHIIWIQQKLNGAQVTNLCLCLPADSHETVVQMIQRRRLQNVQKLIFILNVKKYPNNKVCLGTQFQGGNYWVMATVDLAGPAVLYYDSKAWGCPDNLLPLLSGFTSLFGVPELPPDSLQMAHTPTPEGFQHRCSSLCMRYPLQSGSDTCGILCIIMMVILVMDTEFFTQIIQSQEFIYLHNPSKFAGFLRNMVVSWFVSGTLDTIFLRPILETNHLAHSSTQKSRHLRKDTFKSSKRQKPTSDESSSYKLLSDHLSSHRPSSYHSLSHKLPPDQPSSYKPSSDHSLSYKPSSDHLSSHKPSSDHPSSHKSSSDHSSSHKPSSNHPSSHKPSSDHSLSYKPSSNHPLSHKPSSDHPSCHKPSSDYSSSHKPSSNHPSSHKPSSDHSSFHKPSSNHPSSHKPSSYHSSSHKPSSNHPSSHKPSSDQPLSHKPSSYHSSSHKPSSDQALSHKPSSDHPSSYKPPSDQPLSHKLSGSAASIKASGITKRYVCCFCGKQLSSRQSMFVHKKTLHAGQLPTEKAQQATYQCQTCAMSTACARELVFHYKDVHQRDYRISNITFSSEGEFCQWKKELEQNSFARYVKSCGNRISKEAVTTY